MLPPILERVEIQNLSIGYARVDLIPDRHPQVAGLTLARRDCAVGIVVARS